MSKSDFEDVVRLVSYATREPIIGITTEGRDHDPKRLLVITGFQDEASTLSWTRYHLEKRNDVWVILSHSDIGPFMSSMLLSGTL